MAIDTTLSLSNLTTTSEGIDGVLLTWNNDNDGCLTYAGQSVVEVWRASTNDRSQASKLTEVEGNSYIDQGFSVRQTFYYWVRAKNASGEVGPWEPSSSTGGVAGKPTTNDPGGIRNDINVEDGADVTANNETFSSSDAGDLAFEDLVELAKLGSTIINGGFIKTDLLTADNIKTGTLTGRTIRTSGFDERFQVDASDNRAKFFDSNGTKRITIGTITDNNQELMIDISSPVGSVGIRSNGDIGGIFDGTNGPAISAFTSDTSSSTIRATTFGNGAFSAESGSSDPGQNMVNLDRDGNIGSLRIDNNSQPTWNDKQIHHSGLFQGNLGTLAFCKWSGSGSVLWGQNISGSSLSPANADGTQDSVSLNGTWKCLGFASDVSAQSRTTLFMRIE